MTDLPDDFQTASLAEVDPAIAEVLRRELHRQQSTLEMIASENFVPQAVLEATGSVLTNKYAEGYPRRRYYGGCEEVDVAEQLAIDRATQLFRAEHVNVQPHFEPASDLRVPTQSLQHDAPCADDGDEREREPRAIAREIAPDEMEVLHRKPGVRVGNRDAGR